MFYLIITIALRVEITFYCGYVETVREKISRDSITQGKTWKGGM